MMHMDQTESLVCKSCWLNTFVLQLNALDARDKHGPATTSRVEDARHIEDIPSAYGRGFYFLTSTTGVCRTQGQAVFWEQQISHLNLITS